MVERRAEPGVEVDVGVEVEETRKEKKKRRGFRGMEEEERRGEVSFPPLPLPPRVAEVEDVWDHVREGEEAGGGLLHGEQAQVGPVPEVLLLRKVPLLPTNAYRHTALVDAILDARTRRCREAVLEGRVAVSFAA